jgi:hypothetical protein
MEHTKFIRTDPRVDRIETFDAEETDVWLPVTQKVRATSPKRQEKVEFVEPQQSEPPLGKVHACEASWRGYQLAQDRLKRADRDLGETAAFIAASLTTVTAIQAVISIAKDQLALSNQVLQLAFIGYIAIFILILLLGVFRSRSAMQKRARAERDIDQAKTGILRFCPMEQWPERKE